MPTIVGPTTRLQAADPALLAAILQASGIFFCGGNQLRLTAILGGTPAEKALHQAYRSGAAIAGTSAGAAALSAIMLAYGKSGPTPRSGMAQFTAGLGFTDRVIFDQHFRQRDRLGRLIYAVCNNPRLLGAGVDENTAAVLENTPGAGERITVVGPNAVTIVDGRGISFTDVADLKPNQAAAASNVIIHILTSGCAMSLDTNQVTIPNKALPVD
jgi:cyanophycinase